VLDREDCAKLGMGAFLGVAQGSQEPPQFIHLTYAPRRRARRKVVIIGKGSRSTPAGSISSPRTECSG
jgi:leucyl aminopeptidase